MFQRPFFVMSIQLVVIIFWGSQILAQSTFDAKEYLRKLEYYQFANISIFKADEEMVLRLALVVPSENIGKVFIITTKQSSIPEPIILGAIITHKGNSWQEPDPDFLIEQLKSVNANRILTSEYLRRLSTHTENGTISKGIITKPLGSTLLDHCIAGIKQGLFPNVTKEFTFGRHFRQNRFTKEVEDLARKGVFVVQPRGILPAPTMVSRLAPELAAFAVIDDEMLPYLTRWQLRCETRKDKRDLLQKIHIIFQLNGKPLIDSTLILTGRLKLNGRYRIYEIRCGLEYMNIVEIEKNIPIEILDALSEPELGYGYCGGYDHEALTVAFDELPLPLIAEEYAESSNQGKPFQAISMEDFRDFNGMITLGRIHEQARERLIGRDAIHEYKEYKKIK